MATGESGASGARVPRRANRENNQEHVNVIHQLLSMAERIVMESQRKLKRATKRFLAQVSWDLYHEQFLCFYILLFLQGNSFHNRGVYV